MGAVGGERRAGSTVDGRRHRGGRGWLWGRRWRRLGTGDCERRGISGSWRGHVGWRGRCGAASGLPDRPVAEPTAGALRSGSGAAPGPWVLIYAVDGDLEAAVSAYRDALTADGFTVDDAAEVAGLVSSFAAAGNELRVTVLGSPAAGETSAGMIVTVEQAP